jgi:hypothetical protein
MSATAPVSATADDYTGTIQIYTVTVSGIYDITAIGAGGGSSPFADGGAGALVTADFSLTAGTELEILVGGAGAASNIADGGGGGGGSFVIEVPSSAVIRNTAAVEPQPAPFALVIAGGGGGAGGGPGGPDSAGTAGNTAQAGLDGGGDEGGAGGSGGGGGGGGDSNDGGGGGGGYLTAGATASAAGGASFLAGGANSYAGGFGGGGQGGIEQVTTFTASVTIAPGEIIDEPVEIPGDGGGGGGYSGGGGGGTNEYATASDDTSPSGDAGAGGGGGGSYIDTADEIVIGRGGIIQSAEPAFEVTPVAGSPGTDGAVTIEMLCFLAGTAIATLSGAVAVEALGVGDTVRTADGRAAAVRWIGRRSVDAASPLDRELHYPVRVCRDAIAPGVPARDLLVTGDHALWIDGRLIPARLLVNGASIRAEPAMTDFTYYHLELDRHDLLLAEGLACESYLDTGNRHMFVTDTTVPATRADAAAGYAARGVAPLALAAELVEPVWRRLAARAGVAAPAGGGTQGECAVHLLAGGRSLRPLCAAGERLLFALPAGADEVVIASDTIRPSDRRLWLDDRRRLGVEVRRVRLHAAGEVAEIALDAPQLSAGWHAVERTAGGPARWTAGAARLPLTGGARLLELTLGGRPALTS